MVTSFEFATATRIVFRSGAIAEAPPLAETFGGPVFLATGRDPGRALPLLEALRSRGLEVHRFPVDGEPTVDLAREAARFARDARCACVVALGGGSVLDLGKAVAMLLANGGDPLDYLEVIGRGQPIVRPSVPMIAAPTTAGTGSEVTRNAVLTSTAHGVKASLRGPLMLPTVAIVDPDLTVGLPPAPTACTGMDALTQLIEPFVSTRANPMTDGACREGIARAARSLRRAFEAGEDRTAREDMALASLLGGVALANAGLGAVHGLAAVLGGEGHAPHGALCACLLPHVIAINLEALRGRAPGHPAIARYDEVARILTNDPGARAEGAGRWTAELGRALGIPRLARLVSDLSDIAGIVARSRQASSMKANPIALTDREIERIVEEAR